MKKHGVQDINFWGFMADSAYANLIGVWRVFSSRNPKEPIEGEECMCDFH